MQALLKLLFTSFVVLMIVTPVPPTSIIGFALAAHPKTNRYMDEFTLGLLNWKVRKIKSIFQYMFR